MSIDLSTILITAAKKRFRFRSPKGDLTLEDLFELKSLQDLDTVARAANTELRSLTEESFISVANPKRGEAEMKLELVKLVIAERMAEAERARKAAATRAERAKLLDALEQREANDLAGLTKEQILERLEKLEAA